MVQCMKPVLGLAILALVALALPACGGRDSARPTAGTGAEPAPSETGPTASASPVPRGDASAAEPAAPEGPPPDDAAVVAALEKLGAELERGDDDRVTHVTFPGATTDDQLAGLFQGLPALRGITLSWTELTDTGLRHLAELKQLERLDVSWTNITDASAAVLSQLSGLRTLNVAGTDLSQVAAERVAAALPQARIDVIEAAVVAAARSPAASVAPANPVEALQQEYDAMRQQWISMYRNAPDEGSQQAILDQPPDYGPLARRALDLAKADPGAPLAFQALSWILATDGMSDWRAFQIEALELVRQHHLGDRNLSLLISRVAETAATSATVPFLRAVLEADADEKTKGNAVFALASVLKQEAEIAGQLAGLSEAARQQYDAYYGPEYLDALGELDTAKTLEEVELLFERVTEDYRDFSSLAGAAVSELYVLRNLAVGKPAPEIDGEDIDGVPFKLSDYRGKVVMLDFWGHW